ncbi:MAG: cytochrome c3 family protein, partial [Planctomycetaceae bacterium]
FRMIPNRWQPHARFSHKAHQMMNCAECHDGAVRSEQTADILLPDIKLCQECHSSTPKQPQGGSPLRHFGARADCIECHTYHDHSRDDYTEPLNTILAPSNMGLDTILTQEITKKKDK